VAFHIEIPARLFGEAVSVDVLASISSLVARWCWQPAQLVETVAQP
jgi:hypothetical protein